MSRIEEVDTVKRCKCCFIPLGFKYARGTQELCWECASTPDAMEIRDRVASILASNGNDVECEYCGDIYQAEEVYTHSLPDNTTMISCWPCAAEYSKEFEYEQQRLLRGEYYDDCRCEDAGL